MSRHLTLAELEAGLPEILNAPKDNGTLAAIVIRPQSGQWVELGSCEVSLKLGTHGDNWPNGCWKTTDNGSPHPDVQICIMNARCIALIAQDRDNWAPAGDNLFIDMDLTPGNVPPGTQLAIGTAVIEITDTPHNGWAPRHCATGRRAHCKARAGDKRLNGLTVWNTWPDWSLPTRSLAHFFCASSLNSWP